MRPGTLPSCAMIALAIGSFATASQPDVRFIQPDPKQGLSAAVVVPAETALVFSTQVVGPESEEPGTAPDSLVAEVFDRLDAMLQAGGSGLDRAVRLHVVLAKADLLPVLQAHLVERFGEQEPPALTVVEGTLPRPGAWIGVDAVATTDAQPPAGQVAHPQVPLGRAAGQIAGAPLAVLPGGPRVFIAGQAEPADDLATATRKTLESLAETLEHLGLGTEQVVQLKAFYLPPESAEVVEREVATFFQGNVVPPLVLVEWQSTLPIEIELVATAPDPGSDQVIDYLATPSLPASPVYSRVARVNRGDLVFLSGLFGSEGASGAAQVEEIFDAMIALLKTSGSDLDHLAKATYYVSANDSSQALNDLRPNYYDPNRPPAASKAQVRGVGRGGRSITVDMIAVVPE
ncbi:RidA family protein [Tautonia rosea]|uniref:RidA family protein n=1 Tax=Tautonia rosea TaxID=2728037 RepID=UPI001475854A|nr:RidA family protein [Tautonia rosea]